MRGSRLLGWLYGIADWPTFLATTNRDTAGHYACEVGALGREDALLRALSPDAAALRVPLLVWHGREDGQVPPAQSIAFAEAARAAGGRVTLLVEDGEGHGMARPESWARFRAALRALLAEARP